MKTTDNVSPELRKIEKEIDDYYKSNPLVNLPFATAACSFLTFAEFESRKQVSNVSTSQELETQGDNFINELKEPMFWLFRACEQGGQIPSACDDDVFQASWDLFKLGKKYQWFEAAYTYASNGLIKLELEGSTIQPAKEFFKGMEYQAYGRLMKAHQTDEGMSLINVDDFHSVTDAISSSVKVKGNRFAYKMNPRMVSDAIKAMSPGYDIAFSLPPEWQFSRYSLEDFRKVFEAILAMASIHFRAWRIAIEKGYNPFNYTHSIYVPTCNELLRRIVRYSGVSDEKVLSIFDDLTYGNRGILHPDPALQPLIKLNSKHYAIMPSLWMSLLPERNLTVILNKIPSEREIYADLVGEQEELMKLRFTTDLSTEGFRFIEGNVSSDLPDIDLAIIRDSEKACLLLELKWFIGPAEFREIIDKSKAIKKGVCQSLKFKRAFADSHEPLLTKLGIDTDHRLETIVVSQNWIGHANVQNPEVPVIRADHLIAKLKVTESLRSTMDWLKNREYLPKEGKDFEVHGITSTIDKWNLKWSTTRPLIKDAFFPL